MLVGVCMLAWVAWQFWGTNWVSERKQGQVSEELTTVWDEGKSEATIDNGKLKADAIIKIPAFDDGDDTYAVPILQGVGDDALSAGFGSFTEYPNGKKAAGPGGVGNYPLAAHRVTHGEPLRHIERLDVGDRVFVETQETVFEYKLITEPELVVDFTETWVVEKNPHNSAYPPELQPDNEPGQRLITLTTCSEIFHTDNRTIVYGTLVGEKPRSGS